MKKALLAMAILAAGCSSQPQPEPEVVTVHHRQQTEVVASQPPEAKEHVEVAPSLRLVGEGQAAAAPPPKVQIQMQPQPRPFGPTTRQMAQQALNRLDRLEQSQPRTEIYFLQVGPPLVLNTPPTPAPAPAPVFIAPVSQPAPLAPPPAPNPTPTSDGFSYQNGGVMGTTAPVSTPTPDYLRLRVFSTSLESRQPPHKAQFAQTVLNFGTGHEQSP